jgi:hypothetical protein
MVSTVAFFGKPIDPFRKWTKKCPKLKIPKYFWKKN